MKLKLFLILLVVILIQFIVPSQAERELDDANEDKKTTGRNAAKHKARKCPMERYGMCPDIGEDVADESQKQFAKRRSKCIAAIIEIGRMPTTHRLFGSFLSKVFHLKSNKGNANVQQT